MAAERPELKRGDIVVVAAGGGFGGKPRPALVIQADHYGDLATVVLALFTSALTDTQIRPRFEPTSGNGLRQTSDLMVDILVTAHADRLGETVGALSLAEVARVDRALMTFLGLAGEPLAHRLFFAVRPPAELAAHISGICSLLAVQGRSVAADRLHVTTCIFDDEPRFPAELAQRAAAAGALMASPRFRIVFDRLVGSQRSAVLVPSEPLKQFETFQRHLVAALAREGLKQRQNWRFRPHMTLLFGDCRGLDEWIEPISWQVDEFVLIHSHLGRRRHEVIGRWDLAE